LNAAAEGIEMAPCKRRLLFVTALVGILSICGCVADDEVDKATTQFVQAATTLAQDYQTLLTNANLVEADNYIINQTFAAAPIDDPGIKGSAVLNASEIKARGDAIKALTEYTTALSSLAGSKSGQKIQTDAATASTSAKSLTTDITALVVTPPKGKKAPDFSGPASAAATAIGDVLKVIQDHRSASAIRESIRANDTQITPLYEAMQKESAFYFDRQTSQMDLVEITLLQKYNAAIAVKSIDSMQLLVLSDHLEQYEKDSAAHAASDPAAAIKGFESAHAALIKFVTATKPEDKKSLLADLIAEIKSFAAEVKAPAKSTDSGSTPNSGVTPKS
jgi:hypothetical protein